LYFWELDFHATVFHSDCTFYFLKRSGNTVGMQYLFSCGYPTYRDASSRVILVFLPLCSLNPPTPAIGHTASYATGVSRKIEIRKIEVSLSSLRCILDAFWCCIKFSFSTYMKINYLVGAVGAM
jgi:hypothetical protein